MVSTMHSTKGLEFERVFLPDVNEDVIPHKKSMKEEDVEGVRGDKVVNMKDAG